VTADVEMAVVHVRFRSEEAGQCVCRHPDLPSSKSIAQLTLTRKHLTVDAVKLLVRCVDKDGRVELIARNEDKKTVASGTMMDLSEKATTAEAPTAVSTMTTADATLA